ncbi:MAG: hypothetical protein ILA30_03775, partial [Selenomonas sp.]|nr:hypothetical protein [Selenomonas sp.]
MQKKKIVTAVAIAAFGVSVGFGAVAHADVRPASQGAVQTAMPGQDSSEDKKLASQRFVSSELIQSKLDYQICLPRWYDAGKSYPLIV